MRTTASRTLFTLVAGVLLATSLLVNTSISGASGMKSKSASINIKNFMFSPMKIIVQPGEKVKITNKDSVTHTLTATGGQFNTGNINAHHTTSIRAPLKRGVYTYICNVHQYMTGEIVVK
jgi:plastocyanin